jgi:hypothetical protein
MNPENLRRPFESAQPRLDDGKASLGDEIAKISRTPRVQVAINIIRRPVPMPRSPKIIKGRDNDELTSWHDHPS